MEKRPILLFDSGVGGLTIAKEVIEEFPQEDIIYFGDTAHLPYGERRQEEVKGFVFDIIDYFMKFNPKLIIIACNTATAVGLKAARKHFSVPIIGPINPGVEKAVTHTKNNRIGVIATEGTIASGAYQAALKETAADIEIFSQACPEFVSLVEAGELHSKQTVGIAQDYLLPLKENGIDTLLLGCTHFPYLAEVIQEVVGRKVKLIYPGYSIALQAKEIMKDKQLLASKPAGKVKFYVSDLDHVSDRFVKLGKKFLNFNQLDFEELDLWSQVENDN